MKRLTGNRVILRAAPTRWIGTMRAMEQHLEPRPPSLREILAARGIESSADRARHDYQLRRARQALAGVEVSYIEVDEVVGQLLGINAS